MPEETQPESQENQPKIIDEASVIRTIILGNDWQEVLTSLVVEDGMDPMNLDIVKLADTFMLYMQRLKTFDFRIPARFILIAAILLRMKCEILLEEEEKKITEQREAEKIDIDAPLLAPPVERKPTRKVTMDELIGALGKAFEFREKKEGKELRMRRAVETLIEPEEDIELRISRIFDRILSYRAVKLAELVPWKRKAIVDTFIPLLHLLQRGKVECEQEEFFKDIYIKVVEA